MQNLRIKKIIATHIPLYLSVVLFSLFLLSCDKTESEIKTINILELDKSVVKISEIAEYIEYIPLASDSVLAYIMKVVFFDGEYFVKDNKSKFLRFDKNGNLINKIGRRGKGPGEYKYVSGFVIHPETRNIFIKGGKRGKIMVFSPEGKFIKSFSLTKKYVSSIGISDKNIFLFYLDGTQHNDKNIELLDTGGNVIKSYRNKYKFERGRASISFNAECLLYSLEGKLHFKEIFSDTLFYMDDQKMIPKIILNSGDNRFSPKARTKAIGEVSADPRSSSKTMAESIIQNNLFESSNYLFYSYGYEKKGRMMIYNKSTGESVETDSKLGLVNDWDGGPNIILKMNKDDNTIFAWVNAFELKAHVATEAFKNSTPKYPKKKKELEQLANSLDENDNPVLMLVKLKE